MKLGLFTDCHCSTKEVSCRTRRPSLSYDKIRRAMEALSGADIVICLGDLMDDCERSEDNLPMLRRVSELIGEYSVPFYCMRGNHDCDMFSEEEFYSVIKARPPFSLNAGSSTLIFLNANYSSDGSAYPVRGVDWTDTALPQDQIVQLINVLSDPSVRDAYVFIHQNLDPNVQHQHILSNAAEVRKIIADSGKVRRVIQGHYHPGSDSIVDGIEYHTLPAMCEGQDNYFEIMDV